MFNTLDNYLSWYLNAFKYTHRHKSICTHTHSWSSVSGLSYFLISKKNNVLFLFLRRNKLLNVRNWVLKLNFWFPKQHFLFYYNKKQCMYSHKINKLCLKYVKHGSWNIKTKDMQEALFVSWFKIWVYVKIRTGISHHCMKNFNSNFILFFLCTREQNDRLDTEINIVREK